ncbi:MAG TPA: hypothetical protein VHV75_18655 [Solirubrobacteraceae bacterium]|jgi:hypothetical protein|nr:hypothetical protein [Solirubrobacteraceae bacterium]
MPVAHLELDLPFEMQFEDDVAAVLEDRDGEVLHLVIEYSVDPLALTVEHSTGIYQRQPNGSDQEIAALRPPENKNIQAIDITAALTFLTDVPFRVNRPFPPADIVAEGEEDQAALDAFGTTHIFVQGDVQTSIRTFNPIVDADAVRALMPRAVGLRLYADAVAHTADVARYRELWRILESAFGLQDDDLVAALAAYPPAQELGFGSDELRELKILRGQASHAATRGGLSELLRVGEEVRRKGDRLKCLAERVILTKQTWGRRGNGVEELTPAISWVGPQGQIVIRQRSG